MKNIGQIAYESVIIEGSEKWESLSKINKWYWACIEVAIRKDEREVCAKLCNDADKSLSKADLADRIRARSNA